MTAHHLAQVNISRLIAPIDAPETADFAAALDRINALAEAAPGFIWRLVGDGGNATDIAAFDDPAILINLSVWESPDALAAFAYRTAHVEIMRRRDEWFHKTETYLALWWIPAGGLPTAADARRRLETLARLGPTPEAFTFKTRFPAPEPASSPLPNLDECD